MIVRELKLKLTKKQEATFNEWLWILTGLSGLAVRNWECGTCRVQHDRDVNAAQNVLNFGVGSTLESC